MHRYCILVIEDDHAIRNGLVDALSMSGYDVLSAKDGYEALEVIHAEEYDLVLLDVVLPGANGFELLKRIREDRATVPVLMLTAKGAEADKVKGLKLGADDYVVKPFSLLEVLARIEAVLRRSPERPSAVSRVMLPEGHLDFSTRALVLGNERVALTTKELTWRAIWRRTPAESLPVRKSWRESGRWIPGWWKRVALTPRSPG
ncbi:MAG: response regulator [Akkermansia muciniphila]